MEYKAALTHYTMSGTHSSNFYEFCHGRHDIYYLRKHLEAKPNLNSTVAADLPEEVRLKSIGRPSSRLSSAGSILTTKHKGNKSEVFDLFVTCKQTASTRKQRMIIRERRAPSGERIGVQSKGRRAQRGGTPLQSMGTCQTEYPTAKCCT